MKKRILTFLMAAAMCLSMTACSTVDEADTGAAGGTDTTGEDTASGETASGLPAGIGYRISEEDVSENGYTTWAENASGEIVLDGTANAVFHNHRNLPEEDDDEEDPVVPVQPEKPAAPGAALPVLPGIAIPDTATVPASAQTGDFANPALYTGLAALACGSIAGILVSRRRRRKKKKRA